MTPPNQPNPPSLADFESACAAEAEAYAKSYHRPVFADGYADERSEGMRIKTWHEGMSVEETKDLAYWERNVLALHFAEFYFDDLENNYPGWKRVLSLEGGTITFHIPDDFDIGNLPKLAESNWDGHSTEQKWARILKARGVK